MPVLKPFGPHVPAVFCGGPVVSATSVAAEPPLTKSPMLPSVGNPISSMSQRTAARST